ncbi:MAG: hypothetical protein ACXV5L_09020, partial [Thermoanaerobaculia bacterium]
SRTVLATTAGILGLALTCAISIALGSTMIGSDLSAGRLSFYFSKPVSPAALWLGKVTAALVLIYATLLIVMIPAWMVAGPAWRSVWVSERALIAGLAVAAPVLLFLAHAVSTMFRARSAILIADAVAFLAAAGVLWLLARPLIDANAYQLLNGASAIIAAAVLTVLILAGGWQLSRGRSDRRANHVELSKFLWTSIGAILLLTAGFIAWLVNVQPQDVTQAVLYSSPNGPWTLVGGRVQHRWDYNTAFLLNVADGSSLRIPLRDLNWGGFAFSRDGNVVTWMHAPEQDAVRSGPFFAGRLHGDTPGEVWTRRLNPPSPIRKTGIATSSWAQFVLSDDGERLASLSHGILNIADVATGRSLGSARLNVEGGMSDPAMFFVNRDLVRIFFGRMPPPGSSEKGPRDLGVSLFEYDVLRHSIRPTGELHVVGRFLSYRATSDGSWLIVRTALPADPNDRMFVVDAGTGARVATVPLATSPFDHASSLPDRSSVVVLVRKGRASFVRLTLDGHVLNEIDLGPAADAAVAAANGARVLVTIRERDDNVDRWKGWKSVIVDVARNGVVQTIPNVRPARHQSAYEDDPRDLLPTGPLVAATNELGQVVRFDINTGSVTPLPR